MSAVDIEDILSRLSTKFNRIFYDREFVGSVSEDLQTVIKNTNKCCVLVFPSLSPIYLRVVRYQAKLCDLAVISLGSGSAKSIGVCHKKFFLPTSTEESCEKEGLTKCQMAENSENVTKKRRPPIQLYVPPAQRKSRLNTKTSVDQKEQDKKERGLKTQRISYSNKIIDKSKELPSLQLYVPPAQRKSRLSTAICINQREESTNEETILDGCNERVENDFCCCSYDIEYFLNKTSCCGYQCNCVKFSLFKDEFRYAKLLIFSIKRKKRSFHWISFCKGSTSTIFNDAKFENWAVLNKGQSVLKSLFKSSRSSVFVPSILDFRESLNQKYSRQFWNLYNLYRFDTHHVLFYPSDYIYCYQSVPDFEVIYDWRSLEIYYLLSFQNIEHGSLYYYIDLDIDSLLYSRSTGSPQRSLEDVAHCDNRTKSKSAKLKVLGNEAEKKTLDRVIVLDERIGTPKIELKTVETMKDASKQNEHEQEKEIMRKAKQNINRKTRPIIKYVEDDNDTLKIGKGDNINNWEDLFTEDGELLEDIFTEIVHKVGPEVTVVKAAEDYTAFAAKQYEELEHMVELYDFPPTLETHDIISAFSEINSDSMYVKWVDDTHALLVLGSLSQAQKAMELSSQLIKVRPMSAASSSALKKANQYDLKPAMRRPQTNLQTARRLITSHLGAKSRVSKEQNAKEREDLRVAKELKKQAKQNEKDAWEGNLRSTMN